MSPTRRSCQYRMPPSLAGVVLSVVVVPVLVSVPVVVVTMAGEGSAVG